MKRHLTAHKFEFCNSSKGLCECGLPADDPIHLSHQPRYSFGDVQGTMKDGYSVSVGVEPNDEVNIEFTYKDRRDGKTYRVVATGRRTEVRG